MSSKHGGMITNNEGINFSSAKQKYSFGKGNRFISLKPVVNDKSYDLPQTFGKRAPSFGIGDRFIRKRSKPFKVLISISQPRLQRQTATNFALTSTLAACSLRSKPSHLACRGKLTIKYTFRRER